MVEQAVAITAAEAATEAATNAALEAAAETAATEAVKLTWKEGVMLGLSGIGAAALTAGAIFGVVKLTKFAAKKIRAKKGIKVTDEVTNEAVEVTAEPTEETVEVKVEAAE